jgi:hypothetical protein
MMGESMAVDEDKEERYTDLILCVVDTGELMVIDWMHDPFNDDTGEAWCDPGLRITRILQLAKPGKDTSTLGRFIRISDEYPSFPLPFAAI